MKKSEQAFINQQCLEALKELDIEKKYFSYSDFSTRLYHCQAWIAETDSFLVLKSYDTLVALLDKRTGVLYDVLRCVYDYTSTSAHHIAKFRRYCIEHYLIDYKATTLKYYAL